MIEVNDYDGSKGVIKLPGKIICCHLAPKDINDFKNTLISYLKTSQCNGKLVTTITQQAIHLEILHVVKGT